MPCEYYKKDGTCDLPQDNYCEWKSGYGYCTMGGAVNRDDPI